MSLTGDPSAARPLLNFPNQVTAVRLVLAVVLFVIIAAAQNSAAAAPSWAAATTSRWLYFAATITLAVAAASDWLDGFWARRYGQVTTLGRIFDPFVDKVVVCGTFIFLVASPTSEVAPWMAVVVVARELLVTALRSHVERSGMDFSANRAGKLKMVMQCVAAGTSLGVLSFEPGGTAVPPLRITLIILLWVAVVITVYSGTGYVFAAARLLRRG